MDSSDDCFEDVDEPLYGYVVNLQLKQEEPCDLRFSFYLFLFYFVLSYLYFFLLFLQVMFVTFKCYKFGQLGECTNIY